MSERSDRHSRARKCPAFAGFLPQHRTRSGIFDRMACLQIARLKRGWEFVRGVEFKVRDMPPSTSLERGVNIYSSLEVLDGEKPEIVLYRLTLQQKFGNGEDLALAVRDELVLRLSDISGLDPEEIDPSYGME